MTRVKTLDMTWAEYVAKLAKEWRKLPKWQRDLSGLAVSPLEPRKIPDDLG